MQKLFRKLLSLAALAGLLIWIASTTVARLLPWKDFQDPRTRILWDDYDDSSLVLLGDSAFISYYVDAEAQTLWRKLEARAGASVFPGALDGAQPGDLLLAARVLVRKKNPAAVAFIDIIPTRFLAHRSGVRLNYEEEYLRRHGVTAPDRPGTEYARVVDSNRARLYSWSRDTFLLVSNKSVLENLVNRQRYFTLETRRNRVWNRYGDVARSRYQVMVQEALWQAQHAPFDWAFVLDRTLRQNGIRSVFVLTPLNQYAIHAYSAGDQAGLIERKLSELRQDFLERVCTRGAECIDLFSGFPSEAFADLIHTNALGDDLLAAKLSDWLGSVGILKRRAP